MKGYQKHVLFLLRLVSFEAIWDWECCDADRGKDSAREIREYFIPDFSHWKNHDEYQKVSFGFAQDKFWAVDGGFEGGERGRNWKLETRNWKAEIRNWKLETGNSKLEDGKSKLEIRNSKLEKEGRDVERVPFGRV